MELIEIEFGSDNYLREIKLRDQALRAPLGMEFSKEDLEAEKDELRFGLIKDDGEIAGCLLIRILKNSAVKLRQMAVREENRGQGVGRELVLKVESELVKKNFKRIELHSRMYAKGFYDKLGYTPVGEEFEEIGIPHIKMVKDI